MKHGYESDILMSRNVSDRISKNIDFENFHGEMPPDPRGAKDLLTASRLANIFRNI